MFSGAVNAASEAESRGAQGFMRKPFDPDELVAQAKQMVPV
jgi:DNA-binding NtrC family response regulator